MSMNISSRKNESIKRFRQLSKERKFREAEGEFTAEGAKLCLEALDNGVTVTGSFITEAAIKRYPEVYEKLLYVCAPDVITDELAEYISDTGTPQGVFITAKMLDKPLDSGKIESRRFIILDGLQDTGNIGTVIRTCDALGVDGVILSESCADVYSPKIVRSAMGSLFRLPFIRTPLVPFIEKLKSDGFAVYAAMLDRNAQQLGTFGFPEKTAVIIGNEGNGVSAEAAAAAGRSVYIPIKNAESLNAAVAASIICWEFSK